MRDCFLFSSLILGTLFISGCGGNPTPTPLAPTRTATVTPSPVSTINLSLRTPTSLPPSPTRSSNLAEVTFRWDVGTIITDVDDVTELAVRLKSNPGIAGAYGDEIQITVSYDPKVTTPEKIRSILSDLGFPVKAPQ